MFLLPSYDLVLEEMDEIRVVLFTTPGLKELDQVFYKGLVL